jgi:hypothetical protein
MTSKAACHIELRENSVCEWVKDNTISVKHVTGKLNPADIFTKEMHNGVHFHWLWDSFMTRLADFLNTSLLTIHHAHQRSQNTVAPSAVHVSLSVGCSSFFSVLGSKLFCRSVTAISHLSSAGRYLLWRLYSFVPSNIV